MNSLTRFERGLIAHLVADWLLQNEWIATRKSCLWHPASWTHATIHAGTLGVALGWKSGLLLGFIHWLIDTRCPLVWWQQLIRQRRAGPMGLHIAIWADQVLHLLTIALWIGYSPEPRE